MPAPKPEQGNPKQGQELVNWPGFPDSSIDPASVRARLVLVSILEGSRERAREELSAFVRLHGDAHGRMQGHDVVYATLLAQFLQQSTLWPREAASGDWPTFAGNMARNVTAGEMTDAASIAWRMPLPRPEPLHGGGRAMADDWSSPLSYYPATSGNYLFVNDEREILGASCQTGKPLWGSRNPAIFSEVFGEHGALDTPGINTFGGWGTFGCPRNSLTIADDRLYARMGSAATSWPKVNPGAHLGAASSGYLVCIDLIGEGKLLWKTMSEEGWAMEGAPVVAGERVYMVMRRNEIRPQIHVACYDASTGKLRWRQFVAAAETPGRGTMVECWHDMLTLAGDTLYLNTNLGAVAALSAEDGSLSWVTLYPRDRQGDLLHLAAHWRRDMNPCVYDHGTLLVAPADSSRLLSLDAVTGQFLWQSGTELEDIVHLLGTTTDHLVASGKRLYWIYLRGPSAGRIAHYWPQTEESLGYGRGVLTASKVLWPTRHKLYIFDRNTAQPQKTIDLAAIGASGGNILVVDGRLIIATTKELIGVSPTPIQREIKSELTDVK